VLQDKWRSGDCVAVEAPVPETVKPGSTNSFDVSVKHKHDGSSLKVPVTADLRGDAYLRPGRIDPSPGTATYTAPEKPGATATLKFQSVSRRGIGTLEATVKVKEVKGYTAQGGQGIAITGTICGGVTNPFTLTGRPPDGSTIVFSYSPSNDKGGSLSFKGSGGGFTFAGRGSYSIAPGPGETLILTQSDEGGMTNVPGGRAAHTNRITLTPTDACK
jgi:hypothetical protein